MILTYAYWQRKFGGDSGVIGRNLMVEGKPHNIIGVMPQNFRFLDFDASVLIPYQVNRGEVFIGNFAHQAVARLKPGVTLEQANADVARMIPLAIEKFPLPPGFTRKMIEESGNLVLYAETGIVARTKTKTLRTTLRHETSDF